MLNRWFSEKNNLSVVRLRFRGAKKEEHQESGNVMQPLRGPYVYGVNRRFYDGNENFVKSLKTNCLPVVIGKGGELVQYSDGQTKCLYDTKQGNRVDIVRNTRQSGNPVCTQYGMEREEESELTPLMHAAWRGHAETIQTLLQTEKNDVHFSDSEIGSSLFLAVLQGHGNVVDILLKGGASVNQTGPANETSVFQASANGITDIVEMLCQAGADVNLCNNEGLSSLHKSIMQKHTEVALLLIQRGCDVNKRDSKGNLPLHYAVRHKNICVIESLLNAGTKKDCMNHSNESPLFIGVYTGDIPTLELLINSGCDVNTRKPDGSGLLHAVVSRSNTSDLNPSTSCDIMELLIAAGCQLNTCAYSTLETPLYRALSLQKSALAQFLINHGANPNISSPFDITALHLACRNQNYMTVNLLLHSGIDWKRERWIGHAPSFHTCESAEVFHLLKIWRSQPMSLFNLSRISIRQHFKEKLVPKIYRLPIPKSVKNFLLFSDICDSSTYMISRQYFDDCKGWEPSEADVEQGPFSSRKPDREDIPVS